MSVRIEFYGIPRRRAGVDSVDVDARSVAAALAALDARMPEFARTCLRDGRLRAGYIANLNGRTFLSDPHTPLHDGDALLILSTDAGG
jgi:molybdopterin converting factor small subunit